MTADDDNATSWRDLADQLTPEQIARFERAEQLCMTGAHLAFPQNDRGKTLADMLDTCFAELPSGARPFLETLDVCARPMASSLVFEASALTGDERALASDDAQLVALALDFKRVLPPAPARVIVLSDSALMALRVTHFLLPLNASRNA